MLWLSVVLVATSATTAPAQSNAAETVAEAARLLAAERLGVTAYRLHYDYREYGPAHNKTVVEDSLRLRNNGLLVRVRLLSSVSNGNVASHDDLAQKQSQLDKHLPDEDYRLPVESDALRDYRFSYAASCAGCPAGSTAILFTSIVRDNGHGDGTLAIDPTSHEVLRVEFRPSVFPSHVDSGTIVTVFGRVLPDLWDVVETKQHYTGHLLFMHGGADIDQVYGSYKRFGSLAEGFAALAAVK